MGIKERLDLIIKELGMSGRALERECGLANGSYSSIGDGVGVDKLNKILFRYPQISADWLIKGSGKMLKRSEADNNIGPTFEDSGKIKLPDSLKHEKMNIIILKMAEMLSQQQQDASRLIAEIERNGKRMDRILDELEKRFYENEKFD